MKKEIQLPEDKEAKDSLEVTELKKQVKELTSAFQAIKTQRDSIAQRANDLELQLYLTQNK